MVRKLRHPILMGCVFFGIVCMILFGCITIYLMPQRGIHVSLHELLVEPSMVSGEWELADGGAWEPIPEEAVVEDYGALEGVMRTLRQPQPECKGFNHTAPRPGCNTISHELLKYSNEWQARVAFTSGPIPARSEWRMSREWRLQNLKADAFRFGCEEITRGPYYRVTICTSMARYGSVISIVTFRFFTDHMSTYEIELILHKIDENISSMIKLNEK
jgi:hypothetical protein